jgi:hypothetical protein
MIGRRWHRRSVAVTFGIAASLVVAAVAWAAYGGPATISHFSGNYNSCTALGYVQEGVFDANGASGTFSTDHNGNPSGFSVQVINHGGNPMTFDFFANAPISDVIVKVGSGGSVYHYAPPVTSDSGLESQDSSGAGKTTISHLVFCAAAGPSAVKLLSFSAKASQAGVHVSWKTASEAGTLGFNVYRQVGTVKVKLNSKLIAAKGGLGRASYSIVDRSGTSSARYLLQEIQKNGASKLVARATAAS